MPFADTTGEIAVLLRSRGCKLTLASRGRQAAPYTAGGRTLTFDDPCDYFRAGKAKASTLSLSVLVAIEMFNALNALSEARPCFPAWHASLLACPWSRTLGGHVPAATLIYLMKYKLLHGVFLCVLSPVARSLSGRLRLWISCT